MEVQPRRRLSAVQRACVALAALGLLVGFVGYVLLAAPHALDMGRGLIAVALVGFIASESIARRRRP